MISAVKQKNQISATDVIPRPQAVGISWYGVQNHTTPQEIATPLRARNDGVGEAGAHAGAGAVIEGGRRGQCHTAYRIGGKISKKLLTIL